MRRARETSEARKIKAQAERQAKFDKAKALGKPVILRSWTTDCNDPNEECNTDIIVEYAMPDGNIERKRTHTHTLGRNQA